jgi:autotransporter-associated beta strand protein
VEQWFPQTEAWASFGTMTAARQYLAVTLLNNGTVHISGGGNSGGYLATSERYVFGKAIIKAGGGELNLGSFANSFAGETEVNDEGILTITSSSTINSAWKLKQLNKAEWNP